MLGFYPHTYRALCTQRNTSWGNIPGEFLVKVSLSPLISWQRHTRVLLPGISHSGIRSSPTSVPEDWPQTHRAQSGKRRILFLNNGDFLHILSVDYYSERSQECILGAEEYWFLPLL